MKLRVTVHGVAYDVDVEVLDPGEGFPSQATLTKSRVPTPRPAGGSAPAAGPAVKGPGPAAGSGDGGVVTSPIAGTIIEIKCKPGDIVTDGQILVIIEAMKMKTSIAAPTSGKVKAVPIAAGDSVRESQTLVEFE